MNNRRADRHHHRAPARPRCAPSRRFSYKKSHRPAVRLPAEQPQLLRELPEHDVRGPRRAVRGRRGSWSKALNLLLILHADHEQNCSHLDGAPGRQLAGQPVRVVVGRHLRAVGPAARRRQPGGHRDARAASMRDGGGVQKFVELAKNKNSGFRLMGFGHRVYKNYDPRAKIIKTAARQGPDEAEAAGSAARHRAPARRGRAQGHLLRRAQALPERRLLQRHHLPRARLPDEHVHGHVRASAACRAGSRTGRR